jgi:hypothetical protein
MTKRFAQRTGYVAEIVGLDSEVSRRYVFAHEQGGVKHLDIGLPFDVLKGPCAYLALFSKHSLVNGVPDSFTSDTPTLRLQPLSDDNLAILVEFIKGASSVVRRKTG